MRLPRKSSSASRLTARAQSFWAHRYVTSTGHQPSSGTNSMNRLLVPLRSHSQSCFPAAPAATPRLLDVLLARFVHANQHLVSSNSRGQTSSMSSIAATQPAFCFGARFPVDSPHTSRIRARV